jgi:hypothetical protein
MRCFVIGNIYENPKLLQDGGDLGGWETMMNEEDSKYLAGWLGVGYHKGYFNLGNGLFATVDSWALFGAVFNKAKKQEWWEEFLSHWSVSGWSYTPGFILVDLIGPRFAEEVVAFLKERKK